MKLLAVRALVGALLLAAFAVPASASTGASSTTCNASLIASFRPGLTLSEQAEQIRVTGSLTDCSGGGVSSATVTGSGSGTLSCLSGTASGRFTVTWDTGARTLITGTVDVGAGTVTGTVSKGLFRGEDATGTFTLTPLVGDCIFTPVTRAEADGTISV